LLAFTYNQHSRLPYSTGYNANVKGNLKSKNGMKSGKKSKHPHIEIRQMLRIPGDDGTE